MYGKWVLVFVFALAEIGALQHAEGGRFRAARVRHETHSNVSLGSRRPCDTEQLEYRLTRLEVQTAEKSEMLNSEIRETNRRLQALEYQSADVATSLEEFRNELGRFTESSHQHVRSAPMDNIDMKLDNLAKGLQVVVAAVRNLRTDIVGIKKNISSVAESTKILLISRDDLVTKPFLTNSLVDVKHHQLYQHRDAQRQSSHGLPENCREVQARGNNVSGIYRIQPELSPRAFMVLCDMDVRGGGWTYIHNRYDGMQDFYLNWHSYKLGFGNLGGEFWLGLEYLHQLTGYEVNELLVELVDLQGHRVHAHYGAFSVGNEAEGYALKVLGGYTGDAGDSLIYHAGSKFSTKDLDQDEWPEGSCAQAHTGAWWYRGCDHSNLNGKYLKGDVPESFLYQGMYWGDFHGAQYSLLRARIMVRPRTSRFSTRQDEIPPQ